jgi:hypothetical protein
LNLRAEKFYFSTGRKITSKNKDENNENSGAKILKIGLIITDLMGYQNII